MVKNKKYMVRSMVLPMVAAPADANNTHPPLISQLVFGEMVTELADEKTLAKGWALVAGDDGYEGYVLHDALTDHQQWLRGDEYILARNMGVIFHDADIKSSPLQLLFYPAKVRVVDQREKGNDVFLQLASGGYMLQQQLRPISDKQDPLLVAKMMLASPYLWGGRSFAGIDCSGLTQICYAAAGVVLPRDSGLQYDALKNTVDEQKRQAGDLVFWDGHVAMVLDNDNIIHASAHDMMVLIENHDQVRARLEKTGTAFKGVKRP